MSGTAATIFLLAFLLIGGLAFFGGFWIAAAIADRKWPAFHFRPMGAVRATFRFIGRALGLVFAGGLGVVLSLPLAFLVGVWVSALALFVGLAGMFLIVRYGLVRIGLVRPVVRWLYPYEGWTGDEEGNLPPP